MGKGIRPIQISDEGSALRFMENNPPNRSICKERCGVEDSSQTTCICSELFPGHAENIGSDQLDYLRLAYKTMLESKTPACLAMSA